MIKILNICLHQNSIVIKCFVKIREIFLFLFYDVHKENMFTINLEDGHERPLRLVFVNLRTWKLFRIYVFYNFTAFDSDEGIDDL